MKMRTAILLATCILMSGCVSQAIQDISRSDLNTAHYLRQQIQTYPENARRYCMTVSQRLPLARSIESIIFYESTAEAAAERRHCQERAVERERSLRLLQSNCGCRRTRVITSWDGIPDPDDPEAPPRHEVTDGFATEGANEWHVTDEEGSRRRLEVLVGAKDGTTYPETLSPYAQREKTAFASTSIRPDWDFSDLVDAGTCEPDSDADLPMCQSLLSSVGRDNLTLKACEEAPDERLPPGISSQTALYSATILEAYAMCEDLFGDVPTIELNDYPVFDQDPSILDDYTPPGDFEDYTPPTDDGPTG